MRTQLSGMTGFGRSEGLFGPLRWIWEARSVNGRGLDLKLRLPPGHEALEPAVREQLKGAVRRGSVQIGLTLKRDEAGAAVRIDHAALARLLEAGEPYLRAGRASPPSLDGLLALRGVLVQDQEGEAQAGEDPEGLRAALLAGLEGCLAQMVAHRLQEGAALQAALAGLLDQIARLAAQAGAAAEAQPAALAERLRARLQAFAQDVSIDPQRLAAEAALLAAKADVREELVRLEAHVSEARALLAGGEQAGRRLEFLAQEFQREANTFCAKVGDLALTRLGLDLKTAIDQLREQAANVE